MVAIPELTTVAQQVPLLSFFTGGGLLDMGFEEAGFPVVWTNEVDPAFASLYSAGITSWRKHKNPAAELTQISHVGSMRDIDDDGLIKQVFPKGTPKYFGIIGGPPCQDFSIAGKRVGIEGDRGSLSHDYCLRIDHMQPTFFIFENVAGLLQKKHKAEFDKMREFLSQRYLTDFARLNSLDYGVPQSRERLFMIGIRRDLIKAPVAELGLFLPHVPKTGWAEWHKEYTHANARTAYQWPTSEPLGTTPEAPTCQKQLDLCVNKCLVPEAEEAIVPNAKDRFNLFSKKPMLTPEGLVSNRSFKKLHRYRFSPTACYGNNEVHLHPWENKRLSVREVLRIQGVAESYVLPEGAPLSAKFKMIGNGVPVPLANGVARTVARLLHDYCGITTKVPAASISQHWATTAAPAPIRQVAVC